MAIPRLQVTPQHLIAAANELQQLAQQYQQRADSLVQTAQGTAQHWNGTDNQAFIQQIQQYQNEFNEMHVALMAYATHLQTSAGSYNTAESAMTDQANQLRSRIK